MAEETSITPSTITTTTTHAGLEEKEADLVDVVVVVDNASAALKISSPKQKTATRPPLPLGRPPTTTTSAVTSTAATSSNHRSNQVMEEAKRKRISNDVESYEIINKIGAGTFGTVSRARSRETNEIVALKKVKLENETAGFPVTALREIKILSGPVAGHPNIVRLRHVVTSKPTPSNRNRGNVYLVLDYCEHDLTGLLSNPSVTLNEPHRMCIMRQILEGLHHAHALNVIHRDLKAANILVTSGGVVKIADWGLSRVCPPGGRFTNRVVTLWYRAPELLLGAVQYTSAIDMWAAGCLFAELFTKQSILRGTSETEQLTQILDLCGTPTPTLWPDWTKLPLASNFVGASLSPTPSQINLRFAWMDPLPRALLVKFLTLDPSKRITASNALDDAYFWSSIAPSRPQDIPLPVGDGLHEMEVQEAKFRTRHHHPYLNQ